MDKRRILSYFSFLQITSSFLALALSSIFRKILSFSLAARSQETCFSRQCDIFYPASRSLRTFLYRQWAKQGVDFGISDLFCQQAPYSVPLTGKYLYMYLSLSLISLSYPFVCLSVHITDSLLGDLCSQDYFYTSHFTFVQIHFGYIFQDKKLDKYLDS